MILTSARSDQSCEGRAFPRMKCAHLITALMGRVRIGLAGDEDKNVKDFDMEVGECALPENDNPASCVGRRG